MMKKLIKEEIYNLFESEEEKTLAEEGIKDEDCILSFQKGNEKLQWPLFSLPAAYTCPFATRCKNFPARWDPEVDNEKGGKGAFRRFASTGKTISKTKKTEFLCYAARAQAQYPAANMNAFRNLDLLNRAKRDGGIEGMVKLIMDSISFYETQKRFNFDILRIHEAGDFYSSDYMKAWFEVAKRRPKTLFYAYTTSVPFWIENEELRPSNFKMIASMDDENTELINQHNLRYSRVVGSQEEADKLGLPVDVDDRIAWDEDRNFALMIHGPQHKGSEMAQALKANKQAGVYDKMKLDKEKQQAYKDFRRSILKRRMNAPKYVQGELDFPEELVEENFDVMIEESYYGLNSKKSRLTENEEHKSSKLMLENHKDYKGRVFVHKNENESPYWTVKVRHGDNSGIVLGYDKVLHLENVVLNVSKQISGISGMLKEHKSFNSKDWIPVSYNPLNDKSFVRVDNGEPIFRVKEAVVKNEKEIWVKL